MRRTLFLIALIACTFACKSEDSGEPQKKTAEPERKLAGVYPEYFKCDSVATADALTGVLGAPVRQIENPASVARGTPHPCVYEVSAAQPEVWTFDFDCRDNMKKTADALFAQYTKTSGELVAHYNIASDAGPVPGVKIDAGTKDKTIDAGPEIVRRAPEESAVVQVGAKALDHHGQGLLFIDDDAPCYVRIVGPDSARRLSLAQLVAKNLTFANAPMTPRPFQ
ncbi:MAG: hypothetical protein H0T42_14990 [Deltaproteobacteria bacterium]|nr:hypothetical protein [Deltaproteobacteria bacterium]